MHHVHTPIGTFLQHAMRDWIFRCMGVKPHEGFPESHTEGEPLSDGEPVRFVWAKTVKKSPHNAEMKIRIIRDMLAHRKRYKHVPDKDFDKQILDTAFEQAFFSMRQKYKLQTDESSALNYKRREEHKYLMARRRDRKKSVSI